MTINDRRDEFRRLHEEGTFVIPNPWDRGSALQLQAAGFPALATTSAGLGRALGRDDQQVDRHELVSHVRELASVLEVPLNVDSERLYPDDPGGIAESVRLLADAGASGLSIEDYDPVGNRIIPTDEATEFVAMAAEEAHAYGILLTARAENHLYGVDDVDDTIARLQSYRSAGADVLYAPGLARPVDINRVVEIGPPVNVLAMPGVPPVPELALLGVRRVSTGGALFNTTRTALGQAAHELRTTGTYGYATPPGSA